VVGLDRVAVELEVAGADIDIGVGLGQRFAGVLGFEAGEFVAVGRDHGRGGHEQGRTLLRARPPPFPLRLRRRPHGAVDLVGSSPGDVAEVAAGGRVDVRIGDEGGHMPPADEGRRLGDLRAHRRSSDSAGLKRGRCSLRSARVPEASMLPASSAVAKSVLPVTRPNHTSAEASTTFGGVPRVWRGPAMHCVTPNGGTRTSTLLPSARAASSSSANRTAVATVERSAGPASSCDSSAYISSALRPWSGSILLRIAISASPSYRYWQYPPRARAARQRSSVLRNPCPR